MSDRPLGDGWWLASDGRWYPPQTSTLPPPPTNLPPPPTNFPPPPSQVPGYPTATPVVAYGHPPRVGVSSMLAGWLQGMFWAAGGAYVLSLFAVFALISTTSDLEDASVFDWKAWNAYDDAQTFFGVATALAGVFGIAIFVLVIIWTYQALVGTGAIAVRRRRWSAGWAIASWFIPLANFVIPWMVIRECEQIALERVPARRVESGSTIGWSWWLLWVGASIANFVAGLPNEQQVTNYLLMVATLGYISAAICGALYVRWLTTTINEACGAR